MALQINFNMGYQPGLNDPDNLNELFEIIADPDSYDWTSPPIIRIGGSDFELLYDSINTSLFSLRFVQPVSANGNVSIPQTNIRYMRDESNQTEGNDVYVIPNMLTQVQQNEGVALMDAFEAANTALTYVEQTDNVTDQERMDAEQAVETAETNLNVFMQNCSVTIFDTIKDVISDLANPNLADNLPVGGRRMRGRRVRKGKSRKGKSRKGKSRKGKSRKSKM